MENGQEFSSTVEINGSQATSVIVKNGRLYIGGSNGTQPKIWEISTSGQAATVLDLNLQLPNTTSNDFKKINSIAFMGDELLGVGYFSGNGEPPTAKVWSTTRSDIFTGSGQSSYMSSIFIK